MTHDLETLIAHYTDAEEQSRLTAPSGRLEFLRTQAIISQYIAKPPGVVLDVGGGAGIYSLWLASEGYQVHLIDPVAKHVEQALKASKTTDQQLASASVGDARKLPYADCSVDAVLLLGPLYHLLTREDRIKALTEAHRVLNPSGVLFAVGISRFASSLDGLSRRLLDDPAFLPIVERDLQDGQHSNPTNHPDYFTDSFFHLPEELLDEVEEAGFMAPVLTGVEGPAWLLGDLDAWTSDNARSAMLMSILDKIAEHPSLIGASAHIMAIAFK